MAAGWGGAALDLALRLSDDRGVSSGSPKMADVAVCRGASCGCFCQLLVQLLPARHTSVTP